MRTTRAQNCAGERELVFTLAKHGGMLPKRAPFSQQVILASAGLLVGRYWESQPLGTRPGWQLNGLQVIAGRQVPPMARRWGLRWLRDKDSL